MFTNLSDTDFEDDAQNKYVTRSLTNPIIYYLRDVIHLFISATFIAAINDTIFVTVVVQNLRFLILD